MTVIILSEDGDIRIITSQNREPLESLAEADAAIRQAMMLELERMADDMDLGTGNRIIN